MKHTKEFEQAFKELTPVFDDYKRTQSFFITKEQGFKLKAICEELGFDSLNLSCGNCIANAINKINKMNITFEQATKVEMPKRITLNKQPQHDKRTVLRMKKEELIQLAQQEQISIDPEATRKKILETIITSIFF